MLLETTKKLFNQYHLSQEAAQQYLGDIMQVIILLALNNKEKDLGADEIKNVEDLAERGQIDKMVQLIESKYTPEELTQFSKQKIEPLIESYIKEVLQK